MDEFKLYVMGIIIVVLIFAGVLKKVFSELDENRDFIKIKEDKTPNFSQEEVMSLIDKEREKCEKLCLALEDIFNTYIEKITNENDKNKAIALRQVLLSIKDYPSDELKDKLIKLLPEFEECIEKSLGKEESSEFFNTAAAKYNEIF